jgi:hypothetical protein
MKKTKFVKVGTVFLNPAHVMRLYKISSGLRIFYADGKYYDYDITVVQAEDIIFQITGLK